MGYSGVGMVTVWAYAHRVDTDRFPSVPTGWRWCVSMLPDPSDSRCWLNAGWEPTRLDAELTGQTCAATASAALTLSGVPHERRNLTLEADPCHPDAMNDPLRIES